jgi:hypothetical protein
MLLMVVDLGAEVIPQPVQALAVQAAYPSEAQEVVRVAYLEAYLGATPEAYQAYQAYPEAYPLEHQPREVTCPAVVVFVLGLSKTLLVQSIAAKAQVFVLELLLEFPSYRIAEHAQCQAPGRDRTLAACIYSYQSYRQSSYRLAR